MKKISVILILIFIFSCEKEQHDLTVIGTVKGLKKGIIYLKKTDDTLLVTVDSLVINGNDNFELHSKIESPEMFFLYLDNDDQRISFFADKGITEINTSLKKFTSDVTIKGSKQQVVLEEYLLMMSKFNNKNLDLFKENFDARKANDSVLAKTSIDERNSLLKRKYLYTVNFAINNKDSEVSPYVALTEIYNANIKLLDTINNSLTPKVKASKYGKEFQIFIDNIKAEENK